MVKLTSLRTYFLENSHPAYSETLVKRTAKQLGREGIESMEVLAGTSVDSLKKARNIGEKSLEVALYMRDMFLIMKGDGSEV